MTLHELAALGQRMRTAQKTYFRKQTAALLEFAKNQERQFDIACKDILESHPLFPEPEEARK